MDIINQRIMAWYHVPLQSFHLRVVQKIQLQKPIGQWKMKMTPVVPHKRLVPIRTMTTWRPLSISRRFIFSHSPNSNWDATLRRLAHLFTSLFNLLFFHLSLFFSLFVLFALVLLFVRLVSFCLPLG